MAKTPDAAGPVRTVGRRVRQSLGIDDLRTEVDELRARLEAAEASLREVAADRRSMAERLGAGSDDPASLAEGLRARLDHALLHAEALAKESREESQRALAELRSTLRLTQAMVADAPKREAQREASGPPEPNRPSLPARRFAHPAPAFEHLYRAFEDRHRGSEEEISARNEADYADLLDGLPPAALPVVDLGCGRGELVLAIARRGNPVVGVDSNLGQLVATGDVAGPEAATFVQADLFDWLDDQPDASHRAVFALHVVEHLPLDLQVRLVFEGRRVLVDGGVLVLETPNALSLSTAATNFWVDPTHERPVHPLLLEFLATEAGFSEVGLRPLHPLPLSFRGEGVVPDLVEDLNSLIFGRGDVALIARR